MPDMRPKKGKKNPLVCRAVWRRILPNSCRLCYMDLIKDIDRHEMTEYPEAESKVFWVPYYWIDAKCPHSDSPHKGETLVKSPWEGTPIEGKRSL